MKKRIVILGLGAILACGTLFAMDHSSKWNAKTELNKSQECEGCVFKGDRKNPYTGEDEIQITNNCSDDITVTYEHWSDTLNKYITVSYRIKAQTTSVWLPAEDYRNFSWDWA